MFALPAGVDRPVALAVAEAHGETSRHVARSARGHFELLNHPRTKVPMSVVEAVNGNCVGSRQRPRGLRGPALRGPALRVQ
jgi:hypothetical protein